MSSPSDTPAPSPEQLRQQIVDLRQELITAQTQVLELQDRVQIGQTDQANAVALLGEAELLLEGKIAYILRLDQTLSQRIRELEAECDRKSAEIDNRGQLIAETETRDTQNRAERDAIITDLSERLEQSNQEIGKAHGLAREFDQQRATEAQALAVEKAAHQSSQDQLSRSQADASRLNQALQEMISELKKREAALAGVQADLLQTTGERDDAQAQVQTVQNSALWQWGRPWRALFGPKL